MSKFIVFFIGFILLSGCEKKKEIQHEGMLIPCAPLPDIDGHRFIKTEEGVNLKLPTFADVRRRNGDPGCEYMTSLTIDYLWYGGELISESLNRFRVSKEDYIKIRVFYRGSGEIKSIYNRFSGSSGELSNEKLELWRYDGALTHERYPLQFYPKFFWKDAHTPTKQAELDFRWGILGAKYNHVVTGKPFSAFCSLAGKNIFNDERQIESEQNFAVRGKCRGNVSAEKNGVFLLSMIDVWAGYGIDQKGIMEINQIYDAVVEQLQSFIQE